MDEFRKKQIERMIRGDQDAFDAVYHIYAGSMYRTALLLTGQSQDAEEAVQETFVKCWFSCRELKETEAFEVWLRKILVRTAGKIRRRQRPQASLEQVLEKAAEEGGSEGVLEDPEAVQPLDAVIQKEERFQLWNLLRGLPEKQRTVLILYYYEDLPVKEIAELLGIFQGTVKSRLHQGRTLLRRMLTDIQGQEGGAALEGAFRKAEALKAVQHMEQPQGGGS